MEFIVSIKTFFIILGTALLASGVNRTLTGSSAYYGKLRRRIPTDAIVILTGGVALGNLAWILAWGLGEGVFSLFEIPKTVNYVIVSILLIGWLPAVFIAASSPIIIILDELFYAQEEELDFPQRTFWGMGFTFLGAFISIIL